MGKNPHQNLTDSFALLTGLSQEIEAPLKSLLLSSQTLLDTYKKKDFEYISFKDFQHILTTLEQMNKQINRCCQTTERISGLKRQNTKNGRSQINEVIKDMAALLDQRLSADKIKLSINLKKDLPVVLLSRVSAHQVIHNVLVNAIEAMPGGGGIRIRTMIDKKTQMVVVEVSDDGVGISPNHISKVFEPFFTTREQGMEKSSGLGLSVVHAIIQSAGGNIDLKSSLRKGTQVRISLPISV